MMQVVLDHNGILLKKKNKCFYLVHKRLGQRQISPKKVSSILIPSECLISTAAIKLAVEHQVPIFIATHSGKSIATIRSVGYQNHTSLLRNQVLLQLESRGLQEVLQWLGLKIHGQYENILRFISNGEALYQTYQDALEKFNQLSLSDPTAHINYRHRIMGIEGSFTKLYWQVIRDSIPKLKNIFPKRSKRPALDRGNCMLNYLYGMTYNLVENAIRDAGLNPYIGYYHVDGHQRKSLVFDMIEVFRPWIDALLVKIVMDESLYNKYFTIKETAVYLSKAGRKWLIPLYNVYIQENLSWQDYRTSRKNHMHRFATEFAQKVKKY